MSNVRYSLFLRVLGLCLFMASTVTYLSSVSAQQSFKTQTTTPTLNDYVIPAGTIIPIRFESGDKILLTRQESLKLSLTVAGDITNVRGLTVIPNGSEILGEIRPTPEGSQFFSSQLLIIQNNQKFTYSVNAISQVINNLERLVKGINFDRVVKGAVLGTQAASKLQSWLYNSETNDTGNRLGIDELEVLAVWLLGTETLELISINPNRDLQLTLVSDLRINR